MPELPEVEIVVRELRGQITGKTIQTVQAIWPGSVEQRVDRSPVTGQIQRIDRRGKYIIMRLDETVLVVHLRMTGQLLFFDDTRPAVDGHVRAIIYFSDGSCLQFKDVRKFGRMYHLVSEQEVMKNVGTDALEMDSGHFRDMLKNSKMGLKAFLLNQKHLAGLGNIYCDEALFLSGLYPGRKANSLSATESGRLFRTIRDVLQAAIDNMGSTISDYRDTKGNKGNNQNYFKVYSRENMPCKHCGTRIKKIKMAGRGTHFCPQCQK